MGRKKTFFILSIFMLAGCSDDASGTGSGSGNQENGCTNCTSEQECINNTCVNKTDGKPGDSKPGDSKPGDGTSGGDVQPDACGGRCTGDQTCVDGTCMLTCENKCGTETCCSDGERCDLVLGRCNAACADGSPKCAGDCCRADQVCAEDYGCAVKCSETQTLCLGGVFMGICCDQGTVCERGQCLEECTQADKRCGDLCCDANQVCLDNVCRIACDAETGTRCGKDGEFCCDNSTQTCLYQQCLPRGTACIKNSDCDFDEFCESSTATCVKTDDVPATCLVKPEFGKFSPVLQWHWPDTLPDHKSAFYPTYNQVMMTPVVINMTDDNNDGKVDENDVPDVLFNAFASSKYNSEGVVRALSGDDGRELAATEPIYQGSDDFGAADIDKDGIPELIAATATEIHALSLVKDETSASGYSWKVKYKIAHERNGFIRTNASFADLESDGIVDVVTSVGVLNVADGQFVWKDGCKKSLDRPTLADLDGDGRMEIINTQILDSNCKKLADAGSGFVAVADLMPDSADAASLGELKPELARVQSGAINGKFKFYKIYKKDGVWSTKEAWSADIPINYDSALKIAKVDCHANPSHGHCTSGGGNPVIADFNGDTIPDVGVAARWYYLVYSNDGTASGGKVLWAHSQTQDYSSAVTGSSVFDFEGDGIAEVVYADELNLRVYAGPGSSTNAGEDNYNDPKIIYQTANSSGTLWEYPVIVDVDNDGSTEIVVSSNNYAFKPVTGISVFEDPGRQWVRTRRIWNEHHYHVTNINEDGSVPLKEEVNWLHPKLNNYRQNVQPGGVFNAPNLTADALTIDTSACSSRTVTLNANISNPGSLGIKAGLSVKFYVKDVNGTGQNVLIGETRVPTIMPPGASASASLTWNGKVTLDGAETDVKTPAQIYFVLDEPYDGKAFGEFVECIETDNTSAPVSSNLCVSVN